MANDLAFGKVKEKHMETLNQYVPIVAKVHGDHHPEFHEVKGLFDAISAKILQTEPNKLDLKEEFTQLRKVTDNYTVPDDVCETYEAVYNMLSELDKAYSA